MGSKPKPSSATSREPDQKLTIEELDAMLGGRMPFKSKNPPSETSLKSFTMPLDHQQPSGSINESFIEDEKITSKDKTRRDATHILENLLHYDQAYEEDLPFIKLFQ